MILKTFSLLSFPDHQGTRSRRPKIEATFCQDNIYCSSVEVLWSLCLNTSHFYTLNSGDATSDHVWHRHRAERQHQLSTRRHHVERDLLYVLLRVLVHCHFTVFFDPFWSWTACENSSISYANDFLKLEKNPFIASEVVNRVFHDLPTTQEWQYCQLCFGQAIEN